MGPRSKSTPNQDRDDAGAGRQRRLDAYRRRRSHPQQGDPDYVHLIDLYRALKAELTDASGEWLDLGADTAPYHGLLDFAEVYSADFPDPRGLLQFDYELTAEGRCTAPSGTFDGVLSTQVLEHVDDPQVYLGEALRVLRPGGRLVLTTHGLWQYHPSPTDYWRWTSSGLRLELERAGFVVERTIGVSTGARALLALMSQQLPQLRWPGHTLPALVMRALAIYMRKSGSAFARYADDRFHEDALGEPCPVTLCLLIVASTPMAMC